MSKLPEFKLVVPADFEYVNRNLPTASWYDVYTVKAGEYPVTFTDSDYNPVDDISKAYYAKWSADAILTEEYRVNRLLQHSSAHTTHPNRETKVHGTKYSYEILKPREVPISAYGSYGTKEDNWKRTTHATIVPA